MAFSGILHPGLQLQPLPPAPWSHTWPLKPLGLQVQECECPGSETAVLRPRDKTVWKKETELEAPSSTGASEESLRTGGSCRWSFNPESVIAWRNSAEPESARKLWEEMTDRSKVSSCHSLGGIKPKCELPDGSRALASPQSTFAQVRKDGSSSPRRMQPACGHRLRERSLSPSVGELPLDTKQELTT